jgi:hypothetical protein
MKAYLLLKGLVERRWNPTWAYVGCRLPTRETVRAEFGPPA